MPDTLPDPSPPEQDAYADPFDDAPVPRPAEDGPAPPAPTPRDATGRFVKSEEVAPPTQSPKHSPFWLRRAKDVGLSDDVVAEIDPAALAQVVLQKEFIKEFTHRGEVPQAKTDAPAQPEVPDDFQVPDILDDSVKALFKSLHDRVKQLEGLKGQVGHLAERENVRAQSESERTFDQAFADLGREDVFGKGSGAKLKGTPEMDARIALLRAAGVKGYDDPDLSDKLAKAVKVLYRAPKPDAYEAPAEAPVNRLTPEQQKWLDSGVEKPSSRSAPELPKSVEKAKRTFARLEAERASTNGETPEFEP